MSLLHCGICIAEEAGETPIVLCTSTYHHGMKTEPVSGYASKKHIPLVDVCHSNPDGKDFDWRDRSKKDGEGPKKAWKWAYRGLAEKIVCKEFGLDDRRRFHKFSNETERERYKARNALLIPEE